MELSVNYFANLGEEFHFPKLGCNKSIFLKRRGISVIYSNDIHQGKEDEAFLFSLLEMERIFETNLYLESLTPLIYPFKQMLQIRFCLLASHHLSRGVSLELHFVQRRKHHELAKSICCDISIIKLNFDNNFHLNIFYFSLSIS